MYETICEEVETPPCACPSTYPFRTRKRTIEVPRPTITYPLHEIDTEGWSVFVLDGKLAILGYGRYEAVILVGDVETTLRFDVDYHKAIGKLAGISSASILPNLGEC